MRVLRARAVRALSRSRHRLSWEDEIILAIPINDGPPELYRFLEQLFKAFIPVIPRTTNEEFRVDTQPRIAWSVYWSRTISHAILVCLGSVSAIDRLISHAESTGYLMARYHLLEMLMMRTDHDVGGVVFAVNNMRRKDFGT